MKDKYNDNKEVSKASSGQLIKNSDLTCFNCTSRLDDDNAVLSCDVFKSKPVKVLNGLECDYKTTE